MGNKTSLKYRVVSGANPYTKETYMRPVITERETYYIDQVVAFALKSGYVRGQFEDMKGALNGFIEAIKQLGLDGKAVSLGNWLRVHAELTGRVGESLQLTDANELHVAITALTDLKADISSFSWTNISDTGVIPKIDTITYEGSSLNWVVKKSLGFTCTGRNLNFSSDMGDTVVATWVDGEEAKSATLTPSESGYSYIKFAWPAALDDVPADTEVALNFTLHGGVEGGAAFGSTRSVKVESAS